MEFQHMRWQKFPARCKKISCEDILLRCPGSGAAGAAKHFPALAVLTEKFASACFIQISKELFVYNLLI
jgi:hypothetical protein